MVSSKPIVCHLICFICFISFLKCQSFQYKLEDYFINKNSFNYTANELDQIQLLVNDFNSTNNPIIRIIPIKNQTFSPDALSLNYPNFETTFFIGSLYQGENFFLSLEQTSTSQYRSILTGINLNSGQNWTKELRGREFQSGISLSSNGNLILASGIPSSAVVFPPTYNSPNVIELFNISQAGEQVWKKGFSLSTSDFQDANVIGISKVDANNANGIYILGHFAQTRPFQIMGPAFIIKLNHDGELLNWKTTDHYFHDILVEEDGLYLLDKNVDYANFNLFGFQNDRSSARLIKLDHDLNLIWGKQYSGENFDYLSANMTRTADGRFIMAHTTYGDFPAVLSELDEEGNILTQKGYPNFQPWLLPMSDGSLFLGSPATLTSPPVVARTNPDGEIDGCPTLPACLKAEQFTVQFGTFDIDTLEVLDLVGVDTVLLEHESIGLEPFCDYPQVPVPTFSYPQVLCLSDSATSISDANRLAQSREWRLSGPQTDSVLLDSFEFSFHFNIPGEYVLRQSVWVLGCRYDHEQGISVLPPLDVEILADSIICPDEPREVFASSQRPAEFIWSNGQTGEGIFISSGGTYSVTATDSHCPDSSETEIILVSEILGGQPPFELPGDAVGCLGFELIPQSGFGDQFFTSDDPTLRSSFFLETEGTYVIGMELLGCEFWEEFSYAVECDIEVFVPNAFSPNGDGINDVFRPFGPDMEVIGISVYDRWGGRRLSDGPDWDGGGAPQGTYVFILKYRNLKSGEEKELTGEVTLVR